MEIATNMSPFKDRGANYRHSVICLVCSQKKESELLISLRLI